MITNTEDQFSSAKEPSLLAVVLTALEATGRLTSPPPVSDLPAHFNRDNFRHLHIDERPGGWVANVEFRDIPAGKPDCIGTPERAPFADPRDAFLAGAALVCKIATGSPELPFFVQDGQLICVAYGG